MFILKLSRIYLAQMIKFMNQPSLLTISSLLGGLASLPYSSDGSWKAPKKAKAAHSM